MTGQNFEEQYKKLNQEQKEAVDAMEGPVMVVAGPGTGKTQVLTLRIANIFQKTQVNPDNILALTFTENGAREMRRRLAEIIGLAAYQVNISTFHGFANNLIENNPQEFESILGRRAANEVEQIELLQNVISNSKLKLLRPFGEPFFYLSSARQAIAHLKKEGITPIDFSEILEKQQKEFEQIGDLYYDSGRFKGKMKGKHADFKKQLDKNTELAAIYKNYQSGLAEKKLYDFDDMVLELIKALESNPDFLLRLQEKYQYFLTDEHQDTNNAQNKVLELLSNFFDNPNLFVVGDERQAIFRFQGASLANFLYFKNLYPRAKLISLQKNYRSTQPILDAAQSFIENNQQKLSAVLTGVKDDLISQQTGRRKSENNCPEGEGGAVFFQFLGKKTRTPKDEPMAFQDGKVQIYEFKKPETEQYFIASKIKQLISESVAPAEIAVIYRDNHDARPVAEMLAKLAVPFRIESQKNVLEDPQIKSLITLLRFLNDPASEEKLFEVLHVDFLGISSLDIYKLFSQSAKQRGAILADGVVKRFDLFSDPRSNLERVFSSLLRWQKLAKNVSLTEFFETVIRESGFLSHLLGQSDSAIRLARLESLFSEIKNMIQNDKNFNLAGLINYFDILEKHGVVIKEKNLIEQPNAVRLMTAHGAKGLEFDHVFIINLLDGHWGNRRIPQLIKLPSLSKSYDTMIYHNGKEDSKNDDERRLFYVAVTRARKMAYFSYALSGWGKQEFLPSQFLSEIKTELKEAGPAEEYEGRVINDRSVIYNPRTIQKFSVLDKEYLHSLFFKRGLSATAVNNYLQCPWKYFYLSLLKIPKAKTKHQMYGTAVHAGLKSFFNSLKRDETASKSFLLASFENALKKEPLLEKDFIESLEKGKDALNAYFDYYQNSWKTQTINEFRVKSVMFKLPQGEIKLTGSLDKIELVSADHHPSPPDPWKPVPSVSPSLLENPKSDGTPFATGDEGRWSATNSYQVNVVDYKTGKPKTRNELEGKTQSATGDYKRQLVFYKLLLDSHPTARLKMISGEIDFVEPDQKGNFHKEKFLISDDEVQNLRETISDISDQILNLKFKEKTCGEHDCVFCALKEKTAHV